jgi:hypothetical protein
VLYRSSATAGGHGVAALLKLSCSAGRALGELCAGGGFRTTSVKSQYTHTGVGEMMKEASRDCVTGWDKFGKEVLLGEYGEETCEVMGVWGE